MTAPSVPPCGGPSRLSRARVDRFGRERRLLWIDDDLYADAYAWTVLRPVRTKLTGTGPAQVLTDERLGPLLSFI